MLTSKHVEQIIGVPELDQFTGEDQSAFLYYQSQYNSLTVVYIEKSVNVINIGHLIFL